MARYYHTYPITRKKRRNYSNLFTPADLAKLAMRRDSAFRELAENCGNPTEELYKQYRAGTPIQLQFAFGY